MHSRHINPHRPYILNLSRLPIQGDELEYLLDIIGGIKERDIGSYYSPTFASLDQHIYPKLYRRTLQSLSLVCKAWCRPAQLRLFRSMTFELRNNSILEALESLPRALSSPEDRSIPIQHLKVITSSRGLSYFAAEHEFWEWLSRCKPLRILQFDSFTFPIVRWEQYNANTENRSLISTSLRNITTFALQYDYQSRRGMPEYHCLQQILSYMPSLENLTLKYFDFRGHQLNLPPPPYKLRSCRIFDCRTNLEIDFGWILSSSIDSLVTFQFESTLAKTNAESLLRVMRNGMGASLRRITIIGPTRGFSDDSNETSQFLSHCKNLEELGISLAIDELHQFLPNVFTTITHLRILRELRVDEPHKRQRVRDSVYNKANGLLPNLNKLTLNTPLNVSIELTKGHYSDIIRACEDTGIEFEILGPSSSITFGQKTTNDS